MLNIFSSLHLRNRSKLIRRKLIEIVMMNPKKLILRKKKDYMKRDYR